MELRYPILILIIIIVLVCYLILKKRKTINYSTGSKVANTSYLKNTDYYKKKIKEYKLITKVIQISCYIAILTSTILIGRLAKVETTNINEYNRDIFLCMDVSASVDELNVELVKSLKDTVTSLHGERFGISIFNASSVILVPLTDDYDYVNDILDKIKESIELNISGSYDDNKDDYFYKKNYIISGTLENVEARGSSLIGDGLTSCVYGFSNLDEERTRIIIFSTDNDLAGTPLVALNKAADISKSKNIKVFGIGTKLMKNDDKSELKSAVQKTGGKFYEHSNSTVSGIVSDITKTSKSLLKNQTETREIDIPQIPFIILIISITTLIILNKKVLT